MWYDGDCRASLKVMLFFIIFITFSLNYILKEATNSYTSQLNVMAKCTNCIVHHLRLINTSNPPCKGWSIFTSNAIVPRVWPRMFCVDTLFTLAFSRDWSFASSSNLPSHVLNHLGAPCMLMFHPSLKQSWIWRVIGDIFSDTWMRY